MRQLISGGQQGEVSVARLGPFTLNHGEGVISFILKGGSCNCLANHTWTCSGEQLGGHKTKFSVLFFGFKVQVKIIEIDNCTQPQLYIMKVNI